MDNPANSAEGTSPLLEFATRCRPWLGDLLRRAYTQTELRDADLDAALVMLRAAHGLGSPELAPAPLTFSDLPPGRTAAMPVVLTSIGAIESVNRLAPGQTLRFATSGLTVIYGDNASGKSGYVRILKKLCRVRSGAAEPLLPDVFSSPAGSARVEVRYAVGGGSEQTATWTDGDEAPVDLSRISVFDSRALPLHADDRNELEFLPYDLDVLPRAAAALSELGSRIDREIESLTGSLEPDWSSQCPDTETEALLRRLRPSSPHAQLPTAEEIDSAAAWNDDNDQALSHAEAALAVNDPDAVASRRRSAERLLALADDIDALRRELDDEAIGSIRAASDAARAGREASALAAGEAFANEPLGEVGGDAWRRMFGYARIYSEFVYPGRAFPVTDPGSVCPFCQQPLSREAVDRFVQFREFVEHHAEADAARLDAERDQLLRQIEGLEVPGLDRTTLAISGPAAAYIDAEAAAVVERYLASVRTRRLAAMKILVDGDVQAVDPLGDPPSLSLRHVVVALVAEADAIEAAADPAARVEAEILVRSLRARKLFSDRLPGAHSTRVKLEELHRLREARNECDTAVISRTMTELRRRFITRDYWQRLQAELTALGLDYLPFKIVDRTDHGVSLVRIVLDATGVRRNSDVLSDGECRALALACFLTEASEVPGYSGLVVDDPVSSLDHARVERVARRLVREASENRQVILFTHDLVLYYALREAAAAQRVPWVGHWLRRSPDGMAGVVHEDEEPWQVKKVGARIASLQPRLARIRTIQDRAGDEYRVAVTDFYTMLRETWERLVEELLFADTVTRFQIQVKTLSLRSAAVEDDDHAEVFFAMAKASTYSGHDRPTGRQAYLPPPDELDRDLQQLETYKAQLTRRARDLASRRQLRESPPQGQLA